jgi:hypothetical protein
LPAVRNKKPITIIKPLPANDKAILFYSTTE